MGKLEGRVAIITGASRGIGAAAARVFAGEGARVVLAARSGAELRALVAEIGEEVALAVETDVADEDSVKELVEAAVKRFGRLDVAFNNAADGHRPRPLAEIPTEDFDRTIAVSLRGVFLCMKHEIPAMLAAGGGAIVNMSSTAGAGAWYGIGSYVAAKHGVIGLTRTAAIDYADQGIRVNVLMPGPIFTRPEMEAANVGQYVPVKRMGKPEEVAAAAAWLCSDESSYITGASLAIDGGKLARSA